MQLDIDLSFKGFSLESSSDRKALELLNDSQQWCIELTNWIEFIRSNESVACPTVVRQTKYLSMGLQFTDDFTISKLNKEWRGHSLATDVLSFAVLDENNLIPENHSVELGDIVVSAPRAQIQANEHNHCLTQELRWLVSHGLLHLLGWDHPNSKQLSLMLNFQEKLLNLDKTIHSGLSNGMGQ